MHDVARACLMNSVRCRDARGNGIDIAEKHVLKDTLQSQKLTVLLCSYKYGVTQPPLSGSERCYPNMVLCKLVQTGKLNFSNRDVN